MVELNVLSSPRPWYSDGLKFTCTQCGNCCTGGPGYVWISMEEVGRLAEFLKLTTGEVLSKYCRKLGQRISVKERRMPNGNYDCVFLKEIAGTNRRGCAVYPVRPLQCRTWPFWDSNLASPKNWETASRKCPGMDRGSRKFARDQIESLRDAEDWPQDPPSSGS